MSTDLVVQNTEAVEEALAALQMLVTTLDAVASRHLNDWAITQQDAEEMGLAASRGRQALDALSGSAA